MFGRSVMFFSRYFHLALKGWQDVLCLLGIPRSSTIEYSSFVGYSRDTTLPYFQCEEIYNLIYPMKRGRELSKVKLRFVHAADLHLDSPFRGIRSKTPDHVSDTLYRSTFDAYQAIIDLCITEEVDALLVAGDVYDGADRSLRAQLKFLRD